MDKEKPEWVSVTDRLPAIGEVVLVLLSYGKMDVCHRGIDGDNWWWYNNMRPEHTNGSVNHWMPLPRVPGA